ncbi:NlpC/P60 family protein [Paenibacillus protaetiae]|uniref:NlpC/P60 family protein n=2 Tax=Paenibacillus protaetiae TaxID=2509456 RepID=A0A4P6EZQ6_9BACL|nr:NlpC/P60 family protein [Paenibacillus protaetiae]
MLLLAGLLLTAGCASDQPAPDHNQPPGAASGYSSNSLSVHPYEADGGNTVTPLQSSPYTDPAVKAGLKYIGTPYEFGSNRSTTDTFDCSDFVRQAFKEGYGITLPSDSRAQGEYVRKQGGATTNLDQLKEGDIVFFMAHHGGKKEDYAGLDKAKQPITHDGIYLGNGKMLDTYSTASGGVHIENLQGTFWEYRFLFGGPAH